MDGGRTTEIRPLVAIFLSGDLCWFLCSSLAGNGQEWLSDVLGNLRRLRSFQEEAMGPPLTGQGTAGQGEDYKATRDLGALSYFL